MGETTGQHSKRKSPIEKVKSRMGDSDLDFSLSPVKRSTAKQGRRAGGKQQRGEEDVLEEDTFDMAASPLKSRPMTGDILLDDGPRPRASAPPRRTGGWGDETRAKNSKGGLQGAGARARQRGGAAHHPRPGRGGGRGPGSGR